MTAIDLDVIEARADAASRGPWVWAGNVDSNNLELSNWVPGWGRCAVMRPVRKGMQGATVAFSDVNMRMVRAEERAIFEVAPDAERRSDPRVYRGDIIGIRHPDAEFIAHAREDVPALLAAIRAALSLHPRTTLTTFIPIDPDQTPVTRDVCGLCRDPWPCSTVKALS